MRNILILVLMLPVVFANDALLKEAFERRSEVFSEVQRSTLQDYDWRSNSYAQVFDTPDSDGSRPFSGEEFLDPKKAFALSLLIPGAGEVYAKKPIKGALFFIAEAGLWTGFYLLRTKGIELRDDYEAYHDRHYDPHRFLEWYEVITDSFRVIKGTETLPHHDGNWYDVDKNHDYYEMTGKYNWFLLGWDDVPGKLFDDPEIRATLWNPDLSNEPGPYLNILNAYRDSSYHVSNYMQMRKEANDYFIWGKYMIGAAILNHIVSAFDAAWTAHSHNREVNKSFSNVIDFKTDVAVHNPTGRRHPELKLVVNIR